LPLINITNDEVSLMREKYNGIPEIAWSVVKYWTKDPRKCSENVCFRRGYIK